MKLYTRMLIVALPLAGCTQFDMQGYDPKDYYAKHPIENRVETRTAEVATQFMPGHNRLTADAVSQVRGGLREFSPHAVESARIVLHPSQQYNSARRDHLTRLLRSMGYAPGLIAFDTSDALTRDGVDIVVDYASVVSPRCPDWRTSPVTTYSNTSQAGYGCATVTNLGLMVADPRDLEKGHGTTAQDTNRSSVVIQQYRSNQAIIESSSGGGSSSKSSSSSSSSPAP